MTLISLSRQDRALILAGWVALGLLESAKAYLNSQLVGRQVGWGTVLVGNMPWWLMWAALTPAIVALARRARLDRGGLRSAGVHLVASVVLALIHHLLVGVLFYFTRTRGTEVMIAGQLWPMTLELQLWNFFFSYFVLNVLTYWAALGGYYALEFHRRVKHGELRATRLEADLHEARLEALRMELNPHFLFNTLNTIAALVERGQHEAAVAMLARLGELLRTTLERGSDPQVPLERELEFLEIYLDIVRTRFSDRLQVEITVAPEVRGALVPTLILQPLVENAVRHGIARRPGRGSISITAQQAGGALQLSVTDRAGPELDERQESPAWSSQPHQHGAGRTGLANRAEYETRESGTTRVSAGIGLANTRRRLSQLYGDAAVLRLEPLGREDGTVVTVSLPLAFTAESGDFGE